MEYLAKKATERVFHRKSSKVVPEEPVEVPETQVTEIDLFAMVGLN